MENPVTLRLLCLLFMAFESSSRLINNGRLKRYYDPFDDPVLMMSGCAVCYLAENYDQTYNDCIDHTLPGLRSNQSAFEQLTCDVRINDCVEPTPQEACKLCKKAFDISREECEIGWGPLFRNLCIKEESALRCPRRFNDFSPVDDATKLAGCALCYRILDDGTYNGCIDWYLPGLRSNRSAFEQLTCDVRIKDCVEPTLEDACKLCHEALKVEVGDCEGRAYQFKKLCFT